MTTSILSVVLDTLTTSVTEKHVFEILWDWRYMFHLYYYIHSDIHIYPCSRGSNHVIYDTLTFCILPPLLPLSLILRIAKRRLSDVNNQSFDFSEAICQLFSSDFLVILKRTGSKVFRAHLTEWIHFCKRVTHHYVVKNLNLLLISPYIEETFIQYFLFFKNIEEMFLHYLTWVINRWPYGHCHNNSPSS